MITGVKAFINSLLGGLDNFKKLFLTFIYLFLNTYFNFTALNDRYFLKLFLCELCIIIHQNTGGYDYFTCVNAKPLSTFLLQFYLGNKTVNIFLHLFRHFFPWQWKCYFTEADKQDG